MADRETVIGWTVSIALFLGVAVFFFACMDRMDRDRDERSRRWKQLVTETCEHACRNQSGFEHYVYDIESYYYECICTSGKIIPVDPELE